MEGRENDGWDPLADGPQDEPDVEDEPLPPGETPDTTTEPPTPRD